MLELSGHCLCGRVAYVSGPALLAAVCHCHHCRRQSGSTFAVNVVVARKNLALEGNTKTFSDLGASGLPVQRHFCAECGSPIMSLADSAPGVAFIKGGTLDDPGAILPAMEIWTECALPWAKLAIDLPGHPANPPA